MKRGARLQIPLLAGLIVFPFINLIPILWGFLISFRQPSDAFAIPPRLIFKPTLIFLYEVWIERGFLSFLWNSLVIAAGTICISVPIGTMVAINQPFTIWLMRSFFLDVPVELDEAAMIDGCNRWQAFRLIVLPAVRPGLAVTSLFSALLAYNEFLFALILTGSRTKTLPVAIAEYGGEYFSYWSLSAAGAIGIMLPVVIFTIAVQRHLIRGLTFGPVKG